MASASPPWPRTRPGRAAAAPAAARFARPGHTRSGPRHDRAARPSRRPSRAGSGPRRRRSTPLPPHAARLRDAAVMSWNSPVICRSRARRMVLIATSPGRRAARAKASIAARVRAPTTPSGTPASKSSPLSSACSSTISGCVRSRSTTGGCSAARRDCAIRLRARPAKRPFGYCRRYSSKSRNAPLASTLCQKVSSTASDEDRRHGGARGGGGAAAGAAGTTTATRHQHHVADERGVVPGHLATVRRGDHGLPHPPQGDAGCPPRARR